MTKGRKRKLVKVSSKKRVAHFMSRFHEVFPGKLSFYNLTDGSGCEPRRIAMQPLEQKEVDRFSDVIWIWPAR